MKPIAKVFFKILIYIKRKTCRMREFLYLCKFMAEAEAEGGSVSLSRSVRFMVSVRNGGKGRVEIGDGTVLGYTKSPMYGKGEITLQPRDPEAVIRIGRGCVINNNFSAVARTSISIGDKVLIGHCVNIYDSDFHDVDPQKRAHGGSKGGTEKVSIGDNVWIGSNITILKGVRIGNSSVIASGSMVTKDVPERVLVGGVPAKVIKNL